MLQIVSPKCYVCWCVCAPVVQQPAASTASIVAVITALAHWRRTLPAVLVVLDDELDYFTIPSCFFLVSSLPCLYICIQQCVKYLWRIFKASNLMQVPCKYIFTIKYSVLPRTWKSGQVVYIEAWGGGIYMGVHVWVNRSLSKYL